MTLDRLAKKILDDARVENRLVPFRLVLQYRNKEEGQYVGVAEVSGRVETLASVNEVEDLLLAAAGIGERFKCEKLR